MTSEVPDLNWVRRELADIDKSLLRMANQWETPTVRDVLYELRSVVTMLRTVYPEPDPYASETDAALASPPKE